MALQATQAKHTFVEESRPCRRCGYELKGLRVPGVCPECGTPIRRGRRFESAYTDVPLDRLRMAGVWSSVLAWGVLALCACTLWFLWTRDGGGDATWAALSMAGAGLAMGVAAVAMCTPMASRGDLSTPEPQRTRRGLRIAVLVGLAPVVGAVLCAWMSNASTAASNLAGGYMAGYWVAPAEAVRTLVIGGVLGYLAWTIGGSLLAAYLGSLAGWYDDADLEERFRVFPFVLPLVPLPLLWLGLVPARGLLTFPAWWIMLGLHAAGLWFVVRPLFRFAATARWAARNVDLSHGKDARVARRVRERIEGNRSRARDPKPTVEEPIPLAEPTDPVRHSLDAGQARGAKLPPVARRPSERPDEVPRTGPPLI